MTRLGHSSPRAAMIYQHATRDRDKAIAQALGGLAWQARASQLARPEQEPAGTVNVARMWPTSALAVSPGTG